MILIDYLLLLLEEYYSILHLFVLHSSLLLSLLYQHPNLEFLNKALHQRFRSKLRKNCENGDLNLLIKKKIYHILIDKEEDILIDKEEDISYTN